MEELKFVGRLNSVGFVAQGHVPMAEIVFDPWDQVDDVILSAESSAEVQLEVLRLAASHVAQFVKNRTTSAFGGLMTYEQRNRRLTRADSDKLMHFARIPEKIRALSREELESALRHMRIGVTVAMHTDSEMAIADALTRVSVAGLSYRMVPSRSGYIDQHVQVEFLVKPPNQFTFWRSVSAPPYVDDLNIVPAYHPALQGWESAGLVNGDTDAYITGEVVRSVHCPADARVDTGRPSFFGSWNHVAHPMKAAGSSVVVSVNASKVRSAEGVEELAEFLKASLNLEKKYVAISGGFRPPLEYPHNRIVHLGGRSPYKGGGGSLARGSEAHCVWMYRTLEQEGLLAGASIPPWFHREGWLEIYRGAEVSHGIF